MQTEKQTANTLSLLRKTARTDPLSGLVNRRGLDEALSEMAALGKPFWVAMLDLDDFKAMNDREGHSAGDALLRRTSAAWRAQVRPHDVLARYGGDEFTLVLRGVELNEGIALTERVRAATPPGCSCTAGVAAWTAGSTVDQLLREADACLYAAKAAGRDSTWPEYGSVISLHPQPLPNAR